MAASNQTRSKYLESNLYFYDENNSPAIGASMGEQVPDLAALNPATAIIYFDDFFTYDDTATVGAYAEVGEASTVAPVDAVGGELSIASGAVDNDEKYVSSLHEIFKFAASKPLYFQCRVKLTEAATDDSNIIIGVSDTVGADFLLDNGAGPAASYDGAVFFKVDGGTVWQFETSNAGTQKTTSNAGAFTSATYIELGFIFDPADGTTGTVTPYIDGVKGTALDITLSGLEEMAVVAGVKAGGANAETLLVDYIKVTQIR